LRKKDCRLKLRGNGEKRTREKEVEERIPNKGRRVYPTRWRIHDIGLNRGVRLERGEGVIEKVRKGAREEAQGEKYLG
jgi:hypothetical protein